MEKNSPTVLVIFGVTGDLAQKKLFPAILDLYEKGILRKDFKVVGFSRRDLSHQDFRNFVGDNLASKLGREEKEIFLNNFFYVQGFFDDLPGYKKLSEFLAEMDQKEFKKCSNKLFYLAVPPSYYENIFENLSKSKLAISCRSNWTRVLVEKPFGRDEETAAKLDKILGSLFKEEQIFRIDHYLAKETIQNILTFRFSNRIFEPVWNKKYIESVEIKLFESRGVEGRADTYDSVGTLRDVGQNHILQMLAIVAMEKPKTFLAADVRLERSKVLSNLKKINEKNVCHMALRGQYGEYKSEEGVAPDSKTETYFFLKTEIDNKRWKGVPFYLSSGKALNESKAEIKINFKFSEKNFKISGLKEANENSLIFRIQPDEGISIIFLAKVPGFENKIEPKELSFNYSDSPETEKIPDAYQRVLYDCILGDQTLFASTSEVSVQWKFITPILKAWEKLPLHYYPKGSSASQLKSNKKNENTF